MMIGPCVNNIWPLVIFYFLLLAL